MHGNSRQKITAIVSLLLLVGVACYLWFPPNARARSSVRAILLGGESTTQQLERLEPYVRVGEHIDSVRKRLTPRPDQEVDDGNRAQEWALGLSDVNLVLAVRADGRVIRIGRHIHKLDDGTVWLSPPKPWK